MGPGEGSPDAHAAHDSLAGVLTGGSYLTPRQEVERPEWVSFLLVQAVLACILVAVSAMFVRLLTRDLPSDRIGNRKRGPHGQTNQSFR